MQPGQPTPGYFRLTVQRSGELPRNGCHRVSVTPKVNCEQYRFFEASCSTDAPQCRLKRMRDIAR